MIKLTTKENVRVFKEGDVIDLIKEGVNTTCIVGENGSGKSTILQAVRGHFEGKLGINNSKCLSQINSFDLSQKFTIEHDYKKAFFLDGVLDDPSTMDNSFDATSYIRNGGFELYNLSHGEKNIALLNSFYKKNKEILESDERCLVVFDEIDKGFSLNNQTAIFKFLNLIGITGNDFIISTHNPFLITYLKNCYDMKNRNFVSSRTYINKITGYDITRLNK